MSLAPHNRRFASSINEKHHNKSRFQNVILNDIDKGKGCRNCGDACPGLQLHIWRKVCQFCSCPWEAHDVEIKKKARSRLRLKQISSKKKSITFSDADEIIPAEACEIKIVVEEFPAESVVAVESCDLQTAPQISIEKEEKEVPPEDAPSPLSPTENQLSSISTSSDDETLDSSPVTGLYLWYPLEISANEIETFMASIPPELRPIKGTESAHNCKTVLLNQLPPQDTDSDRCHPLSDKELSLMQQFVNQRENKYRGQGIVKTSTKGNCTSCTEPFHQNELCISAPLLGSNYKYHINCFRCTKCLGFLQELHYYKKGKEIFCGRHHAELFGKRCAGCDEIIFADKITQAEDENWHPEHFCCWYCEKQLGGDDYIKSRNVIMCSKCFTEKINANCFSCKKEIGTEGKAIKYREKSWHLKCFKCSNCDRYLKAEKFIVKGIRIFCQDCFGESQNEITPVVASNCDVCLKQVDMHEPHMSSEGYIWHESCFSCVFCSRELIGKPFLRHTAGLLCEVCYGDRVAHTCGKCNEKIVKGGVKHEHSYFHQDCFNCAYCEIQLASAKFTTKDGKNFCTTCNKKLFSTPNCHQCSKEILGKCFEFKNYNFHPECFVCTGCNIGIAGKDFYQTRGAIYCRKCARKKSTV